MGEEQRVPYDQLLREARERFDAGTDFTVAVEEEFALLDPVSLDLVNRFEDVQAAAAGTVVEQNLAGELIASEAEIKTGRLESFAAAPADPRRASRSAQRSRRAARSHPRGDRVASLGELEGPADHRHAALPPQRSDPSLRGLEEHHVRLPRPYRDQGSGSGNPGDERAPQLAPRAAGPLGELTIRRGRRHRAPLRTDADLHAVFPALRRPRRRSTPGRTTSATSDSSTTPVPSTSTPSSGGACGRISRSRRSRSGSAMASPISRMRSRSRR